VGLSTGKERGNVVAVRRELVDLIRKEAIAQLVELIGLEDGIFYDLYQI